MLNPVDSHYSRNRGDIPKQVVKHQTVSFPNHPTQFFYYFFLTKTNRKMTAGTPCCFALGGSREPINVSSQRGRRAFRKPTVPSGHGQWRSRRDRGRQSGRQTGKGVENMFPFQLFTERKNTSTATLTCGSSTVEERHWQLLFSSSARDFFSLQHLTKFTWLFIYLRESIVKLSMKEYFF